MKKTMNIIAILLSILILSISSFAATSVEDSDLPENYNDYTQVYDLGGGNYLLILQTDTVKGNSLSGEIIEHRAEGEIKLNPLIVVDSVSAHHSENLYAQAEYDELDHVIYWDLAIYTARDFSDFPWPINYIKVYFHVDQGVFGDILIFDQASYDFTMSGFDGDEDFTHYFWQNGVRINYPDEIVDISVEIFEDEAFSIPLDTVNEYGGDVYVKYTLENISGLDIDEVKFSSNLKNFNLTGNTLSGDSIDKPELDIGEVLDFSLKSGEVFTLEGFFRAEESSFNSEEELVVKALVKSALPGLYSLGFDEENIIGSDSYITLKTEEQMADEDFQSNFAPEIGYCDILYDNYVIDEEGYIQCKEGPFKYHFPYGFSQGSPGESKFLENEDSAKIIYEEILPAPITIKYLDEEGNNLVDPIILEGGLGEKWTSAAKDIEGWILKSEPEVKEGVFTGEEQEVVYIYSKAPAEVITKPDLSISKKVNKEKAAAGEELVYTILVKNEGDANSGPVSVQERLPQGISFVSAKGQGSYDKEKGLWTIDEIMTGKSAELIITVKIDKDLEDKYVIKNTVYLEDGGEAQATTKIENPKESLPSTGQRNNLGFLIAGVFLLISGIFTIRRKYS